MSRVRLAACVALTVAFPLLDVSLAQTPSAGRWALLVGVDDYVWFRKLEYCGADMKALSDQLVGAGFPKDHVYLLHDKAQENQYRPMKSAIEAHLQVVLKLVERGDLVVLGFSGHGVYRDGQSYLCPADAKLDDSATMLSVDGLYDQLRQSQASLKLLVVDACRNDPRPAGQRGYEPENATRQFAESLEPPRGILLLTSCAPGEIAREEREFGHGVFMHFLLDGLGGSADANRNGGVSLTELFSYTNDKTKSYVARKFVDSQRPSLKGEIDDNFEFALARVEPTPTPPGR